MPAAIPIAGAVAGSVVSSAMNNGSGGGGGGGEVNKAPWDPAIKPLINSLDTGQGLETYYQQNPFNPLQRVGYQNLFADLDNFRNVMAPQAQAFNNRLMGTNYQRAPAGSELGGNFRQVDASQFLPPEQRQASSQMVQGGLLAAMNGMQGMSRAGGGDMSSLLQALGQGGQGSQGNAAQTGLLGQGMSVVAPNSRNYGLLDWTQLNPFTATNGIPKAPTTTTDPNEKTPEQIAMEEAARRERDRRTDYGGS